MIFKTIWIIFKKIEIKNQHPYQESFVLVSQVELRKLRISKHGTNHNRKKVEIVSWDDNREE